MRKTLFATLFFISSLSSFGQAVVKDQVIGELRNLRNELSTFNEGTDLFKPQLKYCNNTINDAILIIDGKNETFPLNYLQSLSQLTKLAKELSKADTSRQRTLVNVIAVNLKLKFKYRSAQLSTSSYVSSVDVSVTVKGAPKEVNNLRVKYSCTGYHVDFNKPDGQFSALTSPAQDKMVPGLYTLWITKDGSPSVIKNMDVEIDPSKTNHFEFAIP